MVCIVSRHKYINRFVPNSFLGWEDHRLQPPEALSPAPALGDLPEAKTSIVGVALIALLDTGAVVSIILLRILHEIVKKTRFHLIYVTHLQFLACIAQLKIQC